jgi:hypothetical protein
VLIDNLPGMPDGVDAAADGGFWISLVAPAPPFKPLLLSKMLSNPLVRALYARMRPGLKMWGAVVKVRRWLWGSKALTSTVETTRSVLHTTTEDCDGMCMH